MQKTSYAHMHTCTFAHLIMDTLKKNLGILWMLLAPVIVAFMIWQAADKIQAAAASVRTNAALQWIIILIVFVPICAGLFIFGLYAYRGYYDTEPEENIH